MQRMYRADRDLLILALIALFGSLLLQVTPDRAGVTLAGYRLPESCGVKRLTGDGCPACGLTRSFVFGLRADPESLDMHLLGPGLLLLLLLQIPYRSYRLWRMRELKRAGLVDLSIGRGRGLWRGFRALLLILLFSVWLLPQ